MSPFTPFDGIYRRDRPGEQDPAKETEKILIAVLFERDQERGRMSGRVVAWPWRSHVPRHKIVFIDDNKDPSDIIPQDGEIIICEFLADTKPGKRGGVLKVRPLK